MMRRPALALLAVALSGCLTPMKTVTRFDPIGEYGAAEVAEPAVPDWADVKVFYGTSPAGFSLKENELKVEPGFGHQILGTLVVKWSHGPCDRGAPTKDDVITKLRKVGWRHGASAVIYASSRMSPRPTRQEMCPDNRPPEAYGWGWAVRLAP